MRILSDQRHLVYWVTMMHDAFADLTGVVEDTVLEGDKIAARVTWHAEHTAATSLAYREPV